MRLPFRRPHFTDLDRPRLGLSEREVQAIQRPRTGLLVLAGAARLTPVHREIAAIQQEQIVAGQLCDAFDLIDDAFARDIELAEFATERQRRANGDVQYEY